MTIGRTAIRGKIVDFEEKTFGLFIIIIEDVNGERFFNTNAICGRSAFISTYDVSSMYIKQTFDLMETLLIRGEANVVSSNKLKDALKKNEDILLQLTQHTSMAHTVESTLGSRLNILFECNFKVDLDVTAVEDDIQNQDIVANALNRMEDHQNEILRKNFNIPFGVEILQCNTILSPVTGVVAKDLKKGDVINCFPSEEWEHTKNLATSYGFFDEELGEMKKISGTITQIKNESKEISFVLKLQDDLSGVATTDEGVKIEVANEEAGKKKKTLGDMLDEENESDLQNEGSFNAMQYLKTLLLETPFGYYLCLAIAVIVLMVIIYRLL